MMDLIYSHAALTIIAQAGEDSNAGLPGVTPKHPRMPQIRETINGVEFFTVPPTAQQEVLDCTYSSRAWTLQEEFLSRRHLRFTPTHVDFSCTRSRVPESLDTETLSAWHMARPGVGRNEFIPAVVSPIMPDS